MEVPGSGGIYSALPCQAFNQGECLQKTCLFSHSSDSFSLSSGPYSRNVCLLFMMGRCDGFGCNYSHSREDLFWGDEQVKMALHAQAQLVDLYLGRLMRSNFGGSLVPVRYSPEVPFTPAPGQTQYPTPSASTTTLSSFSQGRVPAAVEVTGAAEGWIGFEGHVPSGPHSAGVPLRPNAEATTVLLPEQQDELDESQDTTPQPAKLNPLAKPFIPFIPPLTPPEPITEEFPNFIQTVSEPELEVDAYLAPSEPVTEPVEEEARLEPVQWESKQEEATLSWGPRPGKEGLSWDDEEKEKEAEAFTWERTGLSWDAGPATDDWDVPPKINVDAGGGVDAQRDSWYEPRSFQKKKQGFTSPKSKDIPPHLFPGSSKASSIFQKSKKGTKSPPPKIERWKNGSWRGSPANFERRRSAVIVERQPSRSLPQSPETRQEEPVNYRLKVEPGAMEPSPELLRRIVEGNKRAARQIDRARVAEVSKAEVDVEINWVNGGTSLRASIPDPPREFSQRSRPNGSTWGQKEVDQYPKLGD